MTTKIRRRELAGRRLTRSLGAVIGGLLGVASVPAAVAFADTYEILPDPSSTETVTGFYGLEATPPAGLDSIQGNQQFDLVDTTTHTTVGTFAADVATSPRSDLFLVTDDLGSTNVGTAVGDIPPVGSVIQTELNPQGVGTIYWDFASPSGDVARETQQSAHRDVTHAVNFDAAKGLADNSLGNTSFNLANHDTIASVAPNAETITAISGHPTYDIAVQGTQEFNVFDSTNALVGQFDATETNTLDTFGNYTEELLVTQDVSGIAGTQPGDVPPVGSLFNVFYPGTTTNYDVYSAMPSASGDVINYDHIYPHKILEYHNNFDALRAVGTHSIDVPHQYDFTPIGTEQLSGVNGVPPQAIDAASQGYQQFDVTAPDGTRLGTVDADVNTDLAFNGHTDEALLITALDPGSGIPASDLPPVGSTFDVIDVGGGHEVVYSDLAMPSGDVISRWLVTPSRAVPEHTHVDLSAGLLNDKFFDPFAGTDAVVNADPSAAASVDPSALASSVDLSGAITADSATHPLLNSGALLDPSPTSTRCCTS